MTLYELTSQYQALLDMAGDCDTKTLADTMEAIEGEIEDKADGYAKVIRSLESDAAGIKKEIDRLTTKRAVIENNIRYIKARLQAAMEATGKRKFKTELFSFGIQKNPASVKVTNEAKVPEQFWKIQEPVLDRAELKKYLLEHGGQDYAELVQTESLRIR